MEIENLSSLEPGKLYCLQVDMDTVDIDAYRQIAEELAKEGIRIVVIDKNAKFVSLPDGYEVIKTEGK